MRPIEEIREAFRRIHAMAVDPEHGRPYMSIPANPNRDADLIVSAALDELEALRRRVARAQELQRGAEAQHCAALARVGELEAQLAKAREVLMFGANLLAGHRYMWEHEGDEESGQHDEDCRACEYEALLARFEAALSDKKPVPESPPCEGSRCHQGPGGEWIHSSKSYGSCSVREEEPAPEPTYTQLAANGWKDPRIAPRAEPDPYCLPDKNGHIHCPTCRRGFVDHRPEVEPAPSAKPPPIDASGPPVATHEVRMPTVSANRWRLNVVCPKCGHAGDVEEDFPDRAREALRELVRVMSHRLARGEDPEEGSFDRAWKAACAALREHVRGEGG